MARAHLTAGARTGLNRYVVGAVVRMSLVSCFQVSGDNGEVWGGYGGRVRSVALATTRGCSAFHPLVFAGLAAPHFAHVRRGVMLI